MRRRWLINQGLRLIFSAGVVLVIRQWITTDSPMVILITVAALLILDAIIGSLRFFIHRW